MPPSWIWCNISEEQAGVKLRASLIQDTQGAEKTGLICRPMPVSCDVGGPGHTVMLRGEDLTKELVK